MVDGVILQNILNYGPVFLLIAARAFAMIQTAPLLSSEAIPQVAKLALAGFTAFAVLPTAGAFAVELTAAGAAGVRGTGAVAIPGPEGLALLSDLRFEPFSLRFLLLVIGEGLIGLIIGFFMTIIFAAFSTAGQFFSLQMGFGASETFDPLAQIENPLIGQFFYLIAMLIFMVIGGFQLFLGGFLRSVQSLNVAMLIEGREPVVFLMASGLSRLFMDAIMIAMPILGTLFLVSLTTGLISKAAPQINILSEGFPISIMTAFLLLFLALPFMVEAFTKIINSGFASIESLYIQIGVPIEGGMYGD
ncbi:MAG: flagellar biosynthetic protein FliR [Treponema sp.]|nr:flagellar biosynthetic protein FliR [Treponema sp.]